MFKRFGKFIRNMCSSSPNPNPVIDHKLDLLRKNKSTIDYTIQFISSKMNIKSTPEIFLFEPSEQFYNKPIQKQLLIMQEKIGLSSVSCPIRFARTDLYGAGGRFIERKMPASAWKMDSLEMQFDEVTSYEIKILDKYKNYPLIVCSVLAHELTHLYSRTSGLSRLFNDKDTEEMYCDLTIFLLGFGKLVINSLFSSAYYKCYGGEGSATQQHYLPEHYLCYIYERVNEIIGVPEYISKRNLEKRGIFELLKIRQQKELWKQKIKLKETTGNPGRNTN